MPRRQPVRRAEVPRWRRGQDKAAARQQATAIAREVTRQQEAAARRASVNGKLAASGGWRFRRHLAPFGWLAFLLIAGAGLHASPHPLLLGIVAAVAAGFAAVGFTLHLSRYASRTVAAWSAVSLYWLPALAVTGIRGHQLAWLLAVWAPLTALWVRRCRWVPAAPAADDPARGDLEIWGRLAARRKWTGNLADCQDVPSGRRWRISLDGTETDIGQVLSSPRAIAAAWDKPMTECYAEPSEDGVESRGYLTILRQDSLARTRIWDGTGIDLATGIAAIGTFADGQAARVQFFARRDGIVHTIVAGATGAGKSYLLDLLGCIAIACGLVIPIIMDPQEGQSMDAAWGDRVLYAQGADECMDYLRGIHRGMLARSRYLSGLEWEDPDDPGGMRKGMRFYDPFLSGLPIIMPVLDEAHALLRDRQYAEEAAFLIGDGVKRGRKAGVKWVLATPVPSLREMGGDQAMRSMLVSGNVICLRTADKVTGGMIRLQTEPDQIPRFFADGSKTNGLGYCVGPDNRQAPMRTFLEPAPAKRITAAEIPAMDEHFAAAMARCISRGGVSLDRPREEAPGEVPAGRSAADAVWQVLTEHGPGRALPRGEIAKRAARLATEAWGRPKPFDIRSIGNALKSCADDGRMVRLPGNDGLYMIPRHG